MKTVAGVLVMLGMMLTACDSMPVDPAQQEAATLPEEHEGTQESALTNGDCTASIYCGNSASCSGTEGRCQAVPGTTAYPWGSVKCTTGTSTVNEVFCNPLQVPTCGCKADGCCSELCALDPDCGSSACVSGKSCTSDSQCGGTLSGRCSTSTRKCVCL
jgi:hypothetical protein